MVKDNTFHRTHYLDASVIVKLLVSEEGSEAIKKYMVAEYWSTFNITSFCFAEALGVLKAKYLRKDIDEGTYFAAGDILRGYIGGNRIDLVNVDITDSQIFWEVENTAKNYNLDIIDAYQIVTIKKDYSFKFKDSRPFLITADSQLAEAARREGIRVWNCLKEQAP